MNTQHLHTHSRRATRKFRGPILQGGGGVPLVVTLWRGRAYPWGRRRELSWPDFVQRFVAEPEPSHRKESVAGFSLASFVDNRRALSRVERVHALMFDVDDGSASIDAAVKLWRRTRGAVYTTYSSTPEHPKLRIVVALSRPISPEEHGRLWHWASKRFARAKIMLDESTRDPSRLWYIPSHPIGCTTYAWRELKGPVLDVERLLKGPARSPLLPAKAGRTPQAQGAQQEVAEARAPASESFWGRAFEFAGLSLHALRNGQLAVTCPWAAEHTGGDTVSSTVILPPTGDGWGLFHCRHAHCAKRETLDLLDVLPAAALDAARREHGAGMLRVQIVRALFETRAAWDHRPPLVRWLFDLATPAGELLRARVVVPTPGYEAARATFAAVFPGVRWGSSLATIEGWRRRNLLPLTGRRLDVAVRGDEVTWLRASPGQKIGARTPASRPRSSPRRTGDPR